MLINHIYCGDSNKLLSTIKDNVVDCIITSPPYDDLRIYNKDKKEEYDFDFKGIANQLVRVLAPGGVIVWVVGIQIAEGQQIPTGARIGRVGMSGRTTGPHLHWGLKYGNNYVDPAMVLREMFSQQQIARTGGSRANPQQSQVVIQESKLVRDSGY